MGRRSDTKVSTFSWKQLYREGSRHVSLESGEGVQLGCPNRQWRKADKVLRNIVSNPVEALLLTDANTAPMETIRVVSARAGASAFGTGAIATIPTHDVKSVRMPLK